MVPSDGTVLARPHGVEDRISGGEFLSVDFLRRRHAGDAFF